MYSTSSCPCCLRDTKYTQECILEYANCGNANDPFCNCNQQNATCVQPYVEETVEITDTVTGEDAEATADGLRRLLASGSGDASITGEFTDATLQQYCLDDVTVPASSCPPGKMPAVSYLALEQVHLLIFTIACIHVFLGALLYLAASARLWLQWSRWNARDDPHTILVQDKLKDYYSSLNTPSIHLPIDRSASRTANTDRDGTNSTNDNEMTAINGANTAGDGANNGDDASTAAAAAAAFRLNKPLTKRKSSSRLSSVAAAVIEAAGIDLEAGRQDPRFESSRATSFKQTAAAAAGEEGGEANGGASLDLPSLNETAGINKAVDPSRRYSGSATISRKLIPRSTSQRNGSNKNILIRMLEYLKCFLSGLSPIGVVDHETYLIMRASYIYTHKLSTQFAFLDHVQRNLEDDLSHIVGLSAEFWIIIVLFILSSGPFGYTVTPFMSAVAFILCITNAKLVDITRKVTRKGEIGRLTSSIFWFNRPQLLLIPIKLVLFFCAFIYASFIFFAWQFGDGSCPFKDGFYKGWVLPWYTILIVNTLVFFHMAIVTLPTYSLCVLMGSDVKAHMLPKKFASKLLAVAAAAREKVKAEKAAAAAAAKAAGGDGPGNAIRDGILSALTRISQGMRDTSEISKPKEENNQIGITTSTAAASTSLEARPTGPAAAPSSQANLVDVTPARSAAAAAEVAGAAKKETRLDKAVSLISRRLVGAKRNSHGDGDGGNHGH